MGLATTIHGMVATELARGVGKSVHLNNRLKQQSKRAGHAHSFASQARDEVIADKRFFTIQINAPDSDIVTARVEPSDVVVNSLSLNGIDKSDAGTRRFRCHGRACRSISVTKAVSIHEPELSLKVNGFRYGLNEEVGIRLLSSRPATVLARGWGDLRLVSRTIKLK